MPRRTRNRLGSGLLLLAVVGVVNVHASYRLVLIYNTTSCDQVPGAVQYVGAFKTNTACSLMTSTLNKCTASTQFAGFGQWFLCIGNDQDPLAYLQSNEWLRQEQWVATKSFLDETCANNVVSPKKTFLSAWNLANKCQVPFTSEFVGFQTFDPLVDGKVKETTFAATDSTCSGTAVATQTYPVNSGTCVNNREVFVVQPPATLAKDRTFALTLAFDNAGCKGIPRSVSGVTQQATDCATSFESSVCSPRSATVWTKTHCTNDPDSFVKDTFANATSFMVRKHYEDAFCTKTPTLWESFAADSACSVVLNDASGLQAQISSDGTIEASLYGNAACSGQPSTTEHWTGFMVNRDICANHFRYSSFYRKTPGFAVSVAYGTSDCQDKTLGLHSIWQDDCKNETQLVACEQLQVDGEPRQVWVSSYCALNEDAAINSTFPDVNHLKVLMFTDDTCATYTGIAVFRTQDHCAVDPFDGKGYTINMDADNDMIYAHSYLYENCSTDVILRNYLVPSSGICVIIHRFYHVKKQSDFGLTLLYSNRACVGTPRAFFGAPKENCTDNMKRSICEPFQSDASSYWSLTHCTDDPVTFAKKVFVNRNFSVTLNYVDPTSQCDAQRADAPTVLGFIADSNCVLNTTDRTGYTSTVDNDGNVQVSLYSNATCRGDPVRATTFGGDDVIKLNDVVVKRDKCVQGVKRFSFAQPVATQTMISIPTAPPKRTPAPTDVSTTGGHSASFTCSTTLWTWGGALLSSIVLAFA